MIWGTYAAQNATILTYISQLQVIDSNLPNVANQKWYIWAILGEIFNGSWKIKWDYLDLSWVTVVGSSYTAGAGLALNGTTFSANTANSTTTWAITPTDWNTFNNKQASLGFTPENLANKSTTTTLWTSDTLYPSQNAVKTYVDNKFSTVPTTPVTSVASRTWAIVLTKTDVWLANVQNVDQTNASNLISWTVATARLPSSTTTTTWVVMLENSTWSINQTTAPTSNILKAVWDYIVAQITSINSSISTINTNISAKIWGSGTTNYLPKFTAGGTIGNSTIYDNWNIWIWTSTPRWILDVNWWIVAWDTNWYWFFIPKKGTDPWNNYDRFEIRVDPTLQKTYIWNSNAWTWTPRDLALMAWWNERMLLNATGNVWIWTSTPSSKLNVFKDFNATTNQSATYINWTDTGWISNEVYLLQKWSVWWYWDFSLINAKSAGTSKFYVRWDWNVWIWNSAPWNKLDIWDWTSTTVTQINWSWAGYDAWLRIWNKNTIAWASSYLDFWLAWNYAGASIQARSQSDNSADLVLQRSNTWNVRSDMMYINWDNWYVWIWSTSPTYKLQVAWDVYAWWWLRSSWNAWWYNQSYGGWLYMTDATRIRTYNNKGIYRNTWTIRTDGILSVWVETSPTLYAVNGWNVGIWTNAPTEKLEVAGNIKATSYLFASDRRLKENIETITGALDKVNKLNWVYFDRKKDHVQDLWFIAQEVEKVEPKLVVTWSDGWKAVKYANITSLLVNAVKELTDKIDDLFNLYFSQEEKINAQQVEIDSLKSDIKDIKDNMYLMKMYCK